MLDLSAAFDTVDLDILLSRLQISVGLCDRSLEWFQSYLLGRQYKVLYNGTLSDPVSLVCGVPQGSILGPLLFLLYTTDVESLVHRRHLDYHAYADDQQTYSG